MELAAAGIAYDPPRERVARLAESVPIVRRLLAGEREHGVTYVTTFEHSAEALAAAGT